MPKPSGLYGIKIILTKKPSKIFVSPHNLLLKPKLVLTYSSGSWRRKIITDKNAARAARTLTGELRAVTHQYSLSLLSCFSLSDLWYFYILFLSVCLRSRSYGSKWTEPPPLFSRGFRPSYPQISLSGTLLTSLILICSLDFVNSLPFVAIVALDSSFYSYFTLRLAGFTFPAIFLVVKLCFAYFSANYVISDAFEVNFSGILLILSELFVFRPFFLSRIENPVRKQPVSSPSATFSHERKVVLCRLLKLNR